MKHLQAHLRVYLFTMCEGLPFEVDMSTHEPTNQRFIGLRNFVIRLSTSAADPRTSNVFVLVTAHARLSITGVSTGSNLFDFFDALVRSRVEGGCSITTKKVISPELENRSIYRRFTIEFIYEMTPT